MKIAVLGAAGGIGQPLSLLLKLQLPAGSELALYDVAPMTPGVAKDLSHISTAVKVEGYAGDDIGAALTGADVVVISAGVARKPGMDRSDLFNINAGIIRDLVQNVTEFAPKACIGIITNPVNTTVAIAAEVLKKAGIYDKRRLFGITTLDVLRAETFVAEQKGLEVERNSIPVIGGHSGTTILPIFSQVQYATWDKEEIVELTKRVQNAGTDVVNAKAGSGSATLSMAMAAARFTQALVRGLQGETAVECAYVEGNGEYARFFSQPVRFGHEGVDALLPIGELSQFEQEQLQAMLPQLKADIELGEKFVA
ncbi:malate dehydrogenase [Lonepinella koalarum]|uniref:malate dehydrogenase n=1 Tax=Lonepinella koalarum TaxID=53417 RepID=UPI0011E40F35|nr:malate dehydrogenase [Lonepinella koalarum]TYG33617.1 malate dehydrogenase [Lonepinella koalarum]